MAAIPEDAAEIVILSGDVPLVAASDLTALLEARREDDAAISLATVFSHDPASLGRVIRSDFGTVERIVEAKDATEDELDHDRDQCRACTPSMPTGCAGASRPSSRRPRPASCT